MALNAAKAIGCQVVNIGSQDLIDGKSIRSITNNSHRGFECMCGMCVSFRAIELGNPVLVLGLLWQIIRIQLMGLISLKNVPELVLLLQEGESMASFMKLNPEVILMRWLNYHLRKANSKRVAKNFTTDLMVTKCSALLFYFGMEALGDNS